MARPEILFEPVGSISKREVKTSNERSIGFYQKGEKEGKSPGRGPWQPSWDLHGLLEYRDIQSVVALPINNLRHADGIYQVT